MDPVVKFMTSDAGLFIVMGVVGAIVAIINGFIKDVSAKFFARRELKRNPLCHVNAKLVEFRDGANRVLLSDCEITEIKYGRVILTQWAKNPASDYDKVKRGEVTEYSEPRRMALTCREFKAGYAIYKM